jgi:leucyl-tRNA synthetase
MCERLDIKSYKETDKLKQAKDEVYLKGFYEGVMLVGECAGMKVCDAKPIIRASMIAKGEALPYFEPESTVISRSGDECVVALADQWYLSYGDEGWKQIISNHIHSSNFNGYNSRIMEMFDQAIDWLGEWACSRQFGLGTQLPWDVKWVIESLSDSTVYMAFYTIAQYFHGSIDNLSGHRANPFGVVADQLTDEVFDFIFLKKPKPTTSIPDDVLEGMKREFTYWYPLDLRVSAKDLIPNHLTMALYNHVEIWKDLPEYWPRGIYCNGHIMVDAEKMSKSKGNFLMMDQCVNDFSADATRFALADAGDSVEDANFDRSVANQAILYLYNEEEWIKEVVEGAKNGTPVAGMVLRDSGDMLFMDQIFMNEIHFLIAGAREKFESMCYRDGLKMAWFEMLIVRDMYRDWSSRCGIAMHKAVLMQFIEALVIAMSPITPHWCESLWTVLGHSESITRARWPTFPAYDRLIRKQYLFFREFMKQARQYQLKAKENTRKRMYVYIASTYEPKKVQVLEYMATVVDHSTGSFPATFIKDLKAFLEGNAELKKDTKVLMQFGSFMKSEADDRGLDALAVEMPFNQKAILEV